MCDGAPRSLVLLSLFSLPHRLTHRLTYPGSPTPLDALQDTNQYIANYTNAGKLTPEITDDFKLSGIR